MCEIVKRRTLVVYTMMEAKKWAVVRRKRAGMRVSAVRLILASNGRVLFFVADGKRISLSN